MREIEGAKNGVELEKNNPKKIFFFKTIGAWGGTPNLISQQIMKLFSFFPL
jgi:hypothetical protein